MSQGKPVDAELSARGMRFAIVAARSNGEIVEQLLQGAERALASAHAEDVRVYRCPGAFELAPLCARVARKGGIDGIVALACLIRGGTDHYRLLADQAVRSLGTLALECGTNPRPLAVTFGVLTCESLAQAQERAGLARGDKGGEAALACIEQVLTLKEVGD